MQRFKMLIALGLILIGSISIHADSQTLAIATFVKGKVYYRRKNKTKRVKLHNIFHMKDVIYTSKRSLVSIQIGPNSIVQLAQKSKIILGNILEAKTKRDISLKLGRGQVYVKVARKLRNGSSFKVATPTAIAGVRGTQFMVSENKNAKKKKDIPSGVYVKEGNVAVNSLQTANDEQVNVGAKEQLLIKQGEMQKSVLDAQIEVKMKILETLNLMKENNYKIMKEQRDKSQKIIDDLRKKQEDARGKLDF